MHFAARLLAKAWDFNRVESATRSRSDDRLQAFIRYPELGDRALEKHNRKREVLGVQRA